MNKQNKNTFFIIRVDDKFKKTYKDYCDDNGYTLSKRILSLIKKDIENNQSK